HWVGPVLAFQSFRVRCKLRRAVLAHVLACEIAPERRVGVIVKLSGVQQGFCRSLGVADIEEGATAVAVGGNIRWIELNRLAVVLYGSIVVVLAHVSVAAAVVSGSILGG